jgi:hypothetical protein
MFPRRVVRTTPTPVSWSLMLSTCTWTQTSFANRHRIALQHRPDFALRVKAHPEGLRQPLRGVRRLAHHHTCRCRLVRLAGCQRSTTRLLPHACDNAVANRPT